MTTVPVDLHRETATPPIPEPWTIGDTLKFSITGLVLFVVLFAFMFSLSNM